MLRRFCEKSANCAKSADRKLVGERGRDSMENLSLSFTSLSSSPQRSATQPSSHLLMQKRTIEIKLVSFLVDQGLLIVLFVSVYTIIIIKKRILDIKVIIRTVSTK